MAGIHAGFLAGSLILCCQIDVLVLQDLHELAFACCRAAQILHARQLVHRDLRMGNVVQLGPSKYMVIDLESTATVSQPPLPGDFCNILRTCTSDTLENGRYTTASDMYSIGLLLEDASMQPSAGATTFIGCLKQKLLSADHALQHLHETWRIA